MTKNRDFPKNGLTNNVFQRAMKRSDQGRRQGVTPNAPQLKDFLISKRDDLHRWRHPMDNDLIYGSGFFDRRSERAPQRVTFYEPKCPLIYIFSRDNFRLI